MFHLYNTGNLYELSTKKNHYRYFRFSQYLTERIVSNNNILIKWPTCHENQLRFTKPLHEFNVNLKAEMLKSINFLQKGNTRTEAIQLSLSLRNREIVFVVPGLHRGGFAARVGHVDKLLTSKHRCCYFLVCGTTR